MAKLKTSSDVKIWLITVVLVVLLVAVFYLFIKTSNTSIFSNEESDASAIVGYIGSTSQDTVSLRNGIELAKKDSGIEGLEVLYETSECNTTQATDAMNRLISKNQKTVNKVTRTKVVAVISNLCTEATLALSHIAEQNQVILIVPTSESSAISSAGEYTFRTAPSYTAQAKFVGNYIYSKNNSKLSILYENNEEGALYKEALTTAYRGEVVASESQSVIWEKMIKIVKAKPDSIFIIGGTPETFTSAMQQIRQSNLKMNVYVSESLKTDAISKLGQADGITIIAASSGTSTFKENYRSVYSVDSDKFAAQGYDALAIIASAIKTSGTEGPAVKNTLYSSQIDGASGKIKFDYNGDVIGNFQVFQLRNKQFVPV